MPPGESLDCKRSVASVVRADVGSIPAASTIYPAALDCKKPLEVPSRKAFGGLPLATGCKPLHPTECRTRAI
jgi:hypothetical protein